MPRKLRLRGRSSGIARPSRPAQSIFQCYRCGGLVDPRYGTADDSWCPHCNAIGSVVAQAGQIPMPALYGEWVQEQRAKHAPVQAARFPAATNPLISARFPATTEGSTMKTAKTHTGTYSCLECMIEFDLVAETHLKCDDCKGPLLQGTLEELCDGDDGSEDDQT